MPRGPHFAQIRQAVWRTSQLSISHRFGSVPHRRDVNEKRQNGGSGGIVSGSCGRTDHAVELREYGAGESPPGIPPPCRGVPEIRNRKRLYMPVPGHLREVRDSTVNDVLADHWARHFTDEVIAEYRRRFAAEHVVVL